MSNANDNPPSEPEQMVCGRRISGDANNHYPTPFQESTIYFCNSFCLEAFEADSERFYLAHSRRARMEKAQK